MAASFVIFKFTMKARVRERIAEIKKAGFPVTCAELDEWYSFPKGADNAADTILKAFSEYYEWDDKYLADLPVLGRRDFA